MIRNGRSFSGRERNCCFLNTGQQRFADVSAATGFDFPDDGRGLALVDWDQDGDLDAWIANRSSPQVRLLMNRMQTDHRWVAFRLEGTQCNRDAIGKCQNTTIILIFLLHAVHHYQFNNFSVLIFA